MSIAVAPAQTPTKDPVSNESLAVLVSMFLSKDFEDAVKEGDVSSFPFSEEMKNRIQPEALNAFASSFEDLAGVRSASLSLLNSLSLEGDDNYSDPTSCPRSHVDQIIASFQSLDQA